MEAGGRGSQKERGRTRLEVIGVEIMGQSVTNIFLKTILSNI